MMGKMIEAVTFHRPISTIINKKEVNHAKKYDGLEMNIFIEIAKKLNMTWRINELDGEMDKWGQLLSNGTWKGGIMEQLTSGTAEIGFCTLWMSPHQIPYLDFTTSWTTISSKFLVPRPTVIGISWESLVKPFSLPVWSVVVLCLLLFPASVWVMIHLHLLFTRDQQLSDKTSNIVDSSNSMLRGRSQKSKKQRMHSMVHLSGV
ncbi:uncharacterized protein LOC128998973 [Macrosteles quadrilineatus]|uniref:uncharacterized protein LOC128998973 n=1 Tax=Macrosteles quadrilineatus TaxID=74068 RepID=UPI0023E1A9C5|nr:uncharacterized protein LOC128998973 [Macrosteles quadrilineatus]